MAATRQTKRWFLKHAISIFGLSVVLLGFGITGNAPQFISLVATWLPSSIDPGWATVVGAGLGFVLLSRQTKVGFANLVKQNQIQSELDRESREHQFKLDRKRSKIEANEKSKALASSLLAELGVITDKYNAQLFAWGTQLAIFDGLEQKEIYPALFEIRSPASPVLDQSISNIGTLGPSLGGDIITVYHALKINIMFEANTMPVAVISTTLKAIIEGSNDIILDAYHVQKLLSEFTSNKIPEESRSRSLFFERKHRNEKFQ